MSSGGSVDELWRSFFEERLEEDVRTFVRRYPEDRSLYVDVFDLHRHDAGVVEALFADPDDVLRRGAEALRGIHERVDRVNVRLRNVPSHLGVEDVRARHVSKLVTVEGEVDAVDPVEAAVTSAALVCRACGALDHDRIRGVGIPDDDACAECGEAATMTLDLDRSRLVDVQRVTLAEAGGDDESGTPVRTLVVVLDDDLVDGVSVGASIRVTGIVRLVPRRDDNRFEFYLDGNAVDEQRSGDQAPQSDAPDRVKEAIRSRWESVVDDP